MNWIKSIFVLLLSYHTILISSIIDTNSFETILPYVTKDTLIFCDLDNTLIESTRQIGSTQWSDYISSQLNSSDQHKQKKSKVLSFCWRTVQPYLEVRTVDPRTHEIIQHIQNNQIVVHGLTARFPAEIEYTHEQLLSVNINLARHVLISEKIIFPFEQPVVYDRGIIFCGHNSKGTALNAFLAATGHRPKRIIFLDDKWNHVRNVEKALSDSGIEYIGVRFGGSDERVKSFNPGAANVQFQALPQVLSDEEAQFWYELSHECTAH